MTLSNYYSYLHKLNKLPPRVKASRYRWRLSNSSFWSSTNRFSVIVFSV